ncbi:hypothetical protein N9N66_08420 [Schleiferiaceae bacterium]|jgi:hypothetical protein|nr:hypothetical protein [Schleiferiaceae bacterium]
MEKEKLHTINPERLNELRARLHGIPEQYIVERNKRESKSKKAVLRPFLRLSIAAAASIAFVIFLWPKEQNNSEEFTKDVLSEMYALGYIDMEDLYTYVDMDSLEMNDLELDADIYLDYYNNLDYLEL